MKADITVAGFQILVKYDHDVMVIVVHNAERGDCTGQKTELLLQPFVRSEGEPTAAQLCTNTVLDIGMLVFHHRDNVMCFAVGVA